MRTERTIEAKLKAIFIILEGISIAKSCLRPESAPLTNIQKHYRIFMKVNHVVWASAAVGRPAQSTFHVVQDLCLGLIWFYLWV